MENKMENKMKPMEKGILLFGSVVLLVMLTELSVHAWELDGYYQYQYSSNMVAEDETFVQYRDAFLPENAEAVSSELVTNYVQVLDEEGYEYIGLPGGLTQSVYTYGFEENGQTVYYTIIDMCFSEDIKFTKDDRIAVWVNDYLQPVSPCNGIQMRMKEGGLNKAESRELQGVVGGNVIQIYGNELQRIEGGSRILFHFKSYANPQSDENLQYVISYVHSAAFTFPVKEILVLFVMVSFMCLAIWWRGRRREFQLRMSFLASRNRMLEENYMRVNEFYTANAKLYHDMNHHFNVLYHLLQEGETVQAKEYIHNLQIADKGAERKIHSGINVLDAILCEMDLKAEHKGISFVVETPLLPCNLGIENGDICSLFANLLENAIEASSKEVTLQIKKVNQVLFITIKNDYTVSVVKRGGKFLTRKRNKSLHGWGTRIVEQIVQKYEGSIEYEMGNGVFTVYVMMNEKEGGDLAP